MDTTPFGEAGVVDAPKAVDAVCFFYTCGHHFGMMFGREIVGDVEHDVADDAADGRECIGGDVFKSVLVGCWVFGVARGAHVVFQ